MLNINQGCGVEGILSDSNLTSAIKYFSTPIPTC